MLRHTVCGSSQTGTCIPRTIPCVRGKLENLFSGSDVCLTRAFVRHHAVVRDIVIVVHRGVSYKLSQNRLLGKLQILSRRLTKLKCQPCRRTLHCFCFLENDAISSSKHAAVAFRVEPERRNKALKLVRPPKTPAVRCSAL